MRRFLETVKGGVNRDHKQEAETSDGSIFSSSKLADLIAKHGRSTTTAWLDTKRYCVWRPSESIPESSFLPAQGYLHTDSWVFAWGGPLVSDKAALKPTVEAFISWVQSHDIRPVYCCVDGELEEILGGMGWSTVSCINEDVIDANHVLELTRDDDEGNGSTMKDLKKNLRRAAREEVEVQRIRQDDWSEELKREIEGGISAWKQSRKGLQLAATSLDPWLDFENREYWVARKDGKIIGILILTPLGKSYAIKNAISFPDAPKGTSEQLIHSVLQDLREQAQDGEDAGNLSVSFDISAAKDLKPTRNISGWKITWLSKTYRSVSQGAHLVQRHDFRSKFDTSSKPMFVCYPTEDGLGLEGVEALLKLLRR
ncbi:hypothetical protein HYDPIDRAFT_174752 [Hydnomerulius pinastri MD-312]|nr:hypothetical protein HYDPIDRAFT_174752 [Hydnomerulius pinastri MD-312]